MTLRVALFLSSLTLFTVASAGSVIDLGSDTFDSLTPKGVWFLKFYAPWCGHCKRMAPVLDELSGLIEDADIHVGKVDCDTHSALCRRFGVRAYPTLFLLKGEVQRKYSGDRTARGMLSFLERMALPAVTKSTSTSLGELEESGEVTFAVHTTKGDTPPEWFSEVATSFQGLARFVACDLSSVGGGPAWVVKDARSVPFNPDSTSFEAFVERHRLPLLPELTRSNYPEIVQARRYTLLVAIDRAQIKQARGELEELSLALGDEFTFCWIDWGAWEKYLEQFSVKGAGWVVVLDEEGNDGHFLLASSSPTDITQFVQRIKDNTEPKLGYSYLKMAMRKLEKATEGLGDTISDNPMISIVLGVSVSVLFVMFLIWCEDPIPLPEEMQQQEQKETKAEPAKQAKPSKPLKAD